MMKQVSLFREYWSRFSNKPLSERSHYFASLSRQDRRSLVKSFFEEGWHELFIYNIIDDHLNFIKSTYDIDLIDLRIKALKLNRTFLIEKKVWDHISELILPYSDYYDLDILIGGLVVESWGKEDRFYKIHKRRQNGKTK